ncbi:hypothetical protein BDB00DRAFT_197059 [Zychaea mexicana]|uniref:uncharacterized protein n=1 Tax=Zychaea mexicana TaxID=64656 RepID=UPI0022FE5939|nr:uncharacterized protein BDB00DRAFT_197059 [Zychaea mexicana]KAI9495876.1 hypothetical protein BDB00DRAFT_197059 [Zychaea mexicana]
MALVCFYSTLQTRQGLLSEIKHTTVNYKTVARKCIATQEAYPCDCSSKKHGHAFLLLRLRQGSVFIMNAFFIYLPLSKYHYLLPRAVSVTRSTAHITIFLLLDLSCHHSCNNQDTSHHCLCCCCY